MAQGEARLLNHSYIGTEHILLGLLSEGEGIAAVALSALGITPDAVRGKIDETMGGPGTAAPSGSPPFTPRAKKVLELSLREALQLGHHYIGTEHILLGLLREGEGVGANILVGLGADLSRVRQQVMLHMSGQTGAQEGAATPSAGNPQPRCPQCRAGLGERARFRTIRVPAEDDDAARESIALDVVYCSQCGTMLHVFPA